MKIIIKTILLITFISSTFSVQAQIKFGVTTNLNISTAIQKYGNSSLKIRYDNLYGYNVGVLAEYGMNETLALRSGIKYSKKGFLFGIVIEDVLGETKMNLNYIELPLDIVYHASERISFIVGLYFSQGLGGKAISSDGNTNNNFTIIAHKGSVNAEDILENEGDIFMNVLDLGFNTSIGIKINDNISLNAVLLKRFNRRHSYN